MNDEETTTARDLRDTVREFIRSFDLLEEHRTPCGEPLRVPHAHALMVLYERRDERAPRISALGEHLEIDKANVSRLCQRMAEEGHVELRPCPDDGRAKRVHLTDAGAQVASTVEKSSRERFARLLDALDGTSADEIVEAIDSLNDAIRNLSSNTTGDPDD